MPIIGDNANYLIIRKNDISVTLYIITMTDNKTCQTCLKTFSTNANYKFHIDKKFACVTPDLQTEFKFKCERCDATFQSNKKLESHLNRKFPCKIKAPTPEEIELRDLFEKLQKEHLEQQEQNQQQQEEIEQLKKQVTTTNNNNTINNKNSNNTTNNNITIHVYGKEDMSHITDSMYNHCFRQFDKSVECLFGYKHFSPKMRTNHNMYISNLRDGNMMVRHATQWDLVGKEVTFHKIYGELKSNLFDAWDRMQDDNTTDVSTRPIYPKFIVDDIDDERDAMFERLSCDKMARMAYNNRDFPIEMKKQMDKKKKEKNKKKIQG